MDHITKSYELKSYIDKHRPLDADVQKRLFQKYRLDWNYNSNRIEGNSLTYGETKALILFGITAQGKPLKDHFEVTGHDQAVKWVFDIIQDRRNITETFIRELHQLILKEPYYVNAVTPEGEPTRKRIEVGKYKSSQNHVITRTGETFYFAEPGETPAKMGDLIEWYNSSDLDTIRKAAEFHHKFVLIHPFDDGNGRTARILMNFILMKGGFPPSIIPVESKEEYFRVLRLADTDQMEPFIQFIAESVNNSMELMVKAINGESISSITDIDKEVVLLKEKILSSKDSVREFRNNNSIKNIVNKVIDQITNRYFERVSNFDALYQMNIKSVVINGDRQIYNASFDYKALLENKELKLETIDLVASYYNIRKLDDHDVTFESKMIFRFKETFVEIVGYSVGVTEQLKYDSVMNADEIDSIINPLIEKHKSFLENKFLEGE
ncbi:Fic family protein [Lewinella sp. IMCC34191]|uniref:Fic family protein n=1 Tax=Lewinella sp. IMCC34191 TaxID=2259172 RepID=UPI000E244D6E|nr:Fic family protein [Lewinella sp. IMCC34191]